MKRFDGEGSVKHDFTYHYSDPANRNALSQVTDKGINSPLYHYDKLENMLYDGRRDIYLSYNILNLPDTISQGSDNISYIYPTRGEKLAQRIGSSYTYYKGVIIYAGNTLSYIKQPEDLIRKDSPYYTYNYFLKAHLGSTRVLLEAAEDSLRTVQTTDYYPFSLSFENNNLNRNKYPYIGKEFQDVSLGGRMLSMYDFRARSYDPETGRWFNIDPALQLATPYGFCGNNKNSGSSRCFKRIILW
ncbi:RHS repeat-associated core domain-containing protein [Odoribacter laneus]|uniref:RHS repeat-associated core domain-containing protein n=1 Tax=Odoribacter laneus TaxID=626933 RepID=UPI0023F0C197|nr:RHS repeat-associated core domain-containing protein [Odoribacter laneus]